jgi:hypothetical protein
MGRQDANTPRNPSRKEVCSVAARWSEADEAATEAESAMAEKLDSRQLFLACWRPGGHPGV